MNERTAEISTSGIVIVGILHGYSIGSFSATAGPLAIIWKLFRERSKVCEASRVDLVFGVDGKKEISACSTSIMTAKKLGKRHNFISNIFARSGKF